MFKGEFGPTSPAIEKDLGRRGGAVARRLFGGLSVSGAPQSLDL